MDGIHLTIIVEKHAQVVDVAQHILVFPRAVDVLGRIALQPLAVDVGVEIELSVGIADAGCPDALAVGFLLMTQREDIVSKVEAVETIGDVFPIHQIAGMQDHQSWHGMHRCAGKIIVVTHPQDIGVGELVVEQGIGKGAVAVVGRP